MYALSYPWGGPHILEFPGGASAPSCPPPCGRPCTWHSGVMPPTLHITCEEITHMPLWCDANHTTTILVKKHHTWHSGVMPPTLQHYL